MSQESQNLQVTRSGVEPVDPEVLLYALVCLSQFFAGCGSDPIDDLAAGGRVEAFRAYLTDRIGGDSAGASSIAARLMALLKLFHDRPGLFDDAKDPEDSGGMIREDVLIVASELPFDPPSTGDLPTAFDPLRFLTALHALRRSRGQ